MHVETKTLSDESDEIVQDPHELFADSPGRQAARPTAVVPAIKQVPEHSEYRLEWNAESLKERRVGSRETLRSPLFR